MVRVYLDTCSIQRPLDSKTQIRIILEAEAVLGVLTFCETGIVELVNSEVLQFEVARTPNLARREYALEVLSRAHTFVELNQEIEQRARDFHRQGIKPLDALHLAMAEAADADYLCTCDDDFYKRALTIADVKISVVGPVELIGGLEQ